MNEQQATLHVVATRTGSHLDVRLDGELDLACTALYDTLNDLDLTGVTAVTVDLTALEFCDSMGIASMLRLHEKQTKAGRQVRFMNPQSAVRRTFAVLGIENLLTASPAG